MRAYRYLWVLQHSTPQVAHCWAQRDSTPQVAHCWAQQGRLAIIRSPCAMERRMGCFLEGILHCGLQRGFNIPALAAGIPGSTGATWMPHPTLSPTDQCSVAIVLVCR